MDLTIPGKGKALGLSPLGSSIPSPHAAAAAAFLPSHTIPNLTSGEDPGKHLEGGWITSGANLGPCWAPAPRTCLAFHTRSGPASAPASPDTQHRGEHRSFTHGWTFYPL